MMKNNIRMAMAGLAITTLVFFGAAAGTYFGNQLTSRADSLDASVVLNADAASAGKSLSMASGWVDTNEGVEGLFVLDHLSGTLQCWLINPRTGKIAGIYGTDVKADLELGKGGDNDFVMVCGQFNVGGAARKGNEVPADCICYVGDGNTGKVVGYSFLYNRQILNRNTGGQQGTLKVIARGVARGGQTTRDN